MKAYDIVGYAYEADVHCVDCAVARFGSQQHWRDAVDNEGNPIHPIFAGDENASEEVCGDCFEPLI
jgi:hypothetical protein